MNQKQKHLEQLKDVIRRKHYSLATERTYLLWVAKFWDYALALPREMPREKKVGLAGMITPHNLRHAFATHVIDAGASVRDVQSALGHKSLETTQGYVHPDGLRVQSPLDCLTR